MTDGVGAATVSLDNPKPGYSHLGSEMVRGGWRKSGRKKNVRVKSPQIFFCLVSEILFRR